jgi:hypothetical protein
MSRRNAIAAAVEVHNRAHPTARLPRPAARLLAVMFDSDDICQLSLDALLDASGVSRPTVQSVLRSLLAVGVIAKEEKGHGQHANRYRLHLSLGIDA